MTFEDRVKQLEKRCRLLSIAMTCLLVAGGVFVLAAASQQNEVPTSTQAEKLEIVDESGKVRIRLGKLKDGGYGLSVYDREGDTKRAGVSLGVAGRPELKLRNEESSVEAAASSQHSTITLYESDRYIGVHLEASSKRTSRIIVQNKGGPRFDSDSASR